MIARALAAVGLAVTCSGAPAVASAQAPSASASAQAPSASPSLAPEAAAPPGPSTSADAPRPNVVVLYVDDVGPRISRLWNDRSRTPNLARFAREGVEFRYAITSTPLCGPSRATLLTGRFSHAHTVTDNSIERFDPSTTLATELQGAGYRTLLAGKYLNGLADQAPSRDDVEAYADGWDRFDVVWKRETRGQGQFYDYTLWTRQGTRQKGREARDHSTYVAGTRLAKHIRVAPPHEPVFAVASLASGHWPNTPLAWHRGAADCADVRGYRSPAFDERDVSDKPAYIRELPRLGTGSFPLRTRCQELLGVDAALGWIIKALKETGRFNDTLFIFTADNGYLLGDHRMPGIGGKKWPHAVDVPLYAWWPGELGRERRVVREPVSNVDLAVTICALAGCTLPKADGADLTPLLTGTAGRLARDFLYTELLHDWEAMPPWYGLLTTKRFDPDASWQYIEYANGERELYDLAADPYRLRNVAHAPRNAERVQVLHERLHTEVIEPREVRFRG